MKRLFLWCLTAVAVLASPDVLAEGKGTASLYSSASSSDQSDGKTVVSTSSGLSAGAETSTENTVDGKKVTETNSGLISGHKDESLTSDGKYSSGYGNEIGFEHKTETEISSGEHHEVKTGESDSVKITSGISGDGTGGGDTATVGIGVSKGYDADAETHAGVDGKYGGVNAEADAHAHAGGDAGTQWSVGPDGISGTANVKVGAGAEAHAGVDVRLGTKDYNVHGEADVKISAELAAELKGRLQAGPEGLGAEGELKAGASVGAEGVIKGGVTIWGIPFDVVLTGGVKAGAEASAKGGIMYDAKTGTLTLELGASAVLGVGGNVGATVEIGVGQLFGKVLDAFFSEDDKDENVGKDDKKTGTEDPAKTSNEDYVCPVPGNQNVDDGSPGQTSEPPSSPWQTADDETPEVTDQVLVCEILPLEEEEDYQCDIPEPVPSDDKNDTSNVPDMTEPDWKEEHPVWAWILDNVAPVVVDTIIDWFKNHGDYRIEDIFHIGDDGGCFGGGGEQIDPGDIFDVIRDRIPDFFPDGPPIVIDPDHVDNDPDPGDYDPGDGDIWTDIGDIIKTTVEVIVFPILEQWIDAKLGELIEKYPVIGTIFEALGINTGSIMATIRNIWGVLTGPGSLADKLRQLAQDALQGLVNMLGNLLQWGLNQLRNWLSNVVSGFLGSSGKGKGFVADNIGSPDFPDSVMRLLLEWLRTRQSSDPSGIVQVDMNIPSVSSGTNSLPLTHQHETYSGKASAP